MKTRRLPHVLASVSCLAALCFLTASGRGSSLDLLVPAGGTFDPFLLALKPAVRMSPLPEWMEAPAVISAETATIEVPIAPLWRQSGVAMFAVTVVFEDNGDGGPALEWRLNDGGEVSAISYGLGEIGKPVGLNSRTVLLPQALTQEGGALLVSYYGKFDSLLSLAVRPAREDWTAVMGGRRTAALIDDAFQVYEDREVGGARPVPLSGDVRKGTIIEAELSAALEQIETAIEFIAPVEGVVEGAMMHLESLGLDPEALLEVEVNNVPAGTVSFPPFALDDPSLVTDWNGRMVLAGWRKGSLFIPSRILKQGENSIAIRLQRSKGETGREVFLRNTLLHIRFAAPEFTGVPTHRADQDAEETTADRPSGLPDFHLVEPALPSEDDLSAPVRP